MGNQLTAGMAAGHYTHKWMLTAQSVKSAESYNQDTF